MLTDCHCFLRVLGCLLVVSDDLHGGFLLANVELLRVRQRGTHAGSRRFHCIIRLCHRKIDSDFGLRLLKARLQQSSAL